MQRRAEKIARFQAEVLEYYRQYGRHDLPWRQPEPDGDFDPYKIVVSEIMLQQTQATRVVPKYRQFLAEFPSFAALAAAPLSSVLIAWSGLGYNRRAKFLRQCAEQVTHEHGGQLPQTSEALVRLPGIGVNTAGAILAYAYNKPVVFIETNIRTVFIHHFFADKTGVDDRDILDLAARTLPDDTRTWYWALMDYGSHLKQTVGNLNVLSKHYAKQTNFVGSRRQIRGQVLKLLSTRPHSRAELMQLIPDERLAGVLEDLCSEGFIARVTEYYHLKT